MSDLRWSADGSTIPTIDPHTKAKHLIIEKYVEDLIITLYGKGRRGVDTFTFIDGFCGGGIYKDNESISKEWFGSPVRLIRAVQEGYRKADREYAINLKFIFIDDKQNHIDCLKNYVMPKAGLEEFAQSENCEFIRGEFEDHVNYCVLKADERKGHSFFLLDPQGWTDVSMQSIRKITSMRKSEILYTFMMDPIIRFITKIQTDEKQKRNFEEVLEAKDYYKEADPSQIIKVGMQCYLRQESMRLFREKGNAKYVFSFAAVPRGDTRVLYYLLHISKSLTALEVMKDSFWEENTLGYEYFFNVYGFGFRTVDYYHRNQQRLRFEIEKTKDQECIELLSRDLGRVLESHPDGITFREASEKTMELNPARKSHYEQYIRELREDQLIEIVRDGKVVTNKSPDLRRKDIIRKSRVRQLILPF
jgi:three-Cys-motif partner protein